MAIEEVAHTNPEKIFKLKVDKEKGLDVTELLKVADNLELEDHKSQIVFLLKHLYDCFIEKDCDMIEINPLVLT